MAELAIRPTLDSESVGWLRSLAGTGPERERTFQHLHALLLCAARSEVARLRVAAGRDLEDLAMQSADDALVAILGKLHTYRGASRFTTWAYKFALLEAAAKVRRRRWEAREVQLDSDGWERLYDDKTTSPEGEAQTAEIIGAIRRGMAEQLTPHQRAVLVAVTLDDVPIDVLAERRDTTRGAIYKTVHDARRKLRRALASDGLLAEPAGTTSPMGSRSGPNRCLDP
jgi:RNA polymerase sigma-70 factor, ECF subfamily